MPTLILFPHQCFPFSVLKPYLTNLHNIILWEDPVFFGDRRGQPGMQKMLRLNKLRLIYMHAVFRHFFNTLKQQCKIPVHLISFDQIHSTGGSSYNHLVSDTTADFVVFDPADHLLMKRMRAAGLKMTVLDSPAFCMTGNDITEYMNEHRRKKLKRLRHAPFFQFVKNKLQILQHQKSLDTMNRQPLPADAPLPPSPWLPRHNHISDKEWQDAKEWVESHPLFRTNPGNSDVSQLHFVATNEEESMKWLHKFLHDRFALFGTFEDAIHTESPMVYHSGLSVYLNMGLITPSQVLQEVRRHFSNLSTIQQKQQLPSYEGFVRQLLGWREFARLYYEAVPHTIYRFNTFSATKRALSRFWYDNDGISASKSSGVPIVDAAIQDAWKYGYLHHIRRLMVIANYMTLLGVHPDKMYQWMYEFSLDAWDWVMIFNCYSMGSWSDGGHSMRKPYVSGPNYLRKMAREPYGTWESAWTSLYKDFLQKHKQILKHTQLASQL